MRLAKNSVGLSDLALTETHLENLEIALERVSDQNGIVVEQLRQILLNVL